MIGRTLSEPRLRFLDGGTSLVDAGLAELAAIHGGAIRQLVE